MKSTKKIVSGLVLLLVFVPFLENKTANHPSALASAHSPAQVHAWMRLEDPTVMPHRTHSLFTLNPVNQVGLLFGGNNQPAGLLNDLWLTDGRGWIQFHALHRPEPRAHASLAYDEARRELILFGGLSSSLLGETWSFDGVEWAQKHPQNSPAPRINHSMAYDAEREAILLFGGQMDVGGKYLEATNEMWLWDGENWQQQFPALLPPARWGAGMVYDPARQSILLFGGAQGGANLADTWIWDGTYWIEMQIADHPAGRANFSMAYDELRQRVVLLGGQTYLDVDRTETWTWDGENWALLPTLLTPSPDAALHAQLVYLPDLQTIALYSSYTEKIPLPDDTFTFREHSEFWALSYHWIGLPLIAR